MARTRALHSLALDVSGHAYTRHPNGGNIIDLYPARRLIDSSYTSDELHPAWATVRQSKSPIGTNLDIGGPFDSVSVKFDVPPVGSGAGEGSGPDRGYDGPATAFFTFGAPDSMSSPMNASHIVLQIPDGIDGIDTRFALGGTAIARCRPARPEAALTVSLVELLREGMPSLLSKLVTSQGRLAKFRGLGKDYLNAEFGWRPFLSEIRDVSQAVVNQEKILTDLTRNSGKRLRRRYAFAPTTNSSKSTDGFMPWPNLSVREWHQASHEMSYVSSKRTWFSGEFMYRVPKLDGIGGVGTRARHLLGLDLTPSTLWDLTPWTWLSDWFGNTGDVLANISAMSADDLVMRYGYLMQEAKYEVTSTHEGVTTHGYGMMPSTISGKVTYCRKTRVPASPFGFGLTNADLSDRQYAVLAALGISRGR